jgi:hypothetical protein
VGPAANKANWHPVVLGNMRGEYIDARAIDTHRLQTEAEQFAGTFTTVIIRNFYARFKKIQKTVGRAYTDEGQLPWQYKGGKEEK